MTKAEIDLSHSSRMKQTQTRGDIVERPSCLTLSTAQKQKRPPFDIMAGMTVRRLSESSELSQLRGRGGYVLNIGRSGARIHKSNCATVMWMNLRKRRGVYHAASLREALEWLEAEGIGGVPCRLCLPTLAYRPRPEKLMDRIK